MLVGKRKELLIQKVVKEISPAFIILFGSFAKGSSNADSDIDIAYFSDKKLSPYERFILASELSNLAEREVDFIDIKQIDTVFTAQIFSEGIPIYIADENTLI